MRLTAEDAKKFGVVERILSEKETGQKAFYDRIQALMIEELNVLSTDPDLAAHRYARYRTLGVSENVGDQI